MIFSIFLQFGISYVYYIFGNVLSEFNLIFSNSLFFIIISLIGKFGLWPANLGLMGIVDGISLFGIIIWLFMNK